MNPFRLAVLTTALAGPVALAQPSPQGASPEELVKKLDAAKGLDAKDKTFEVASAMGKLYYSQGRYAEAVKLLAEAEEKAAPARKALLDARRRAGAAAPVEQGCADAGAALDVKVKAAQALQPVNAAACLSAALTPLAEVYEVHGRALAMTGDVAAAATSYAQLLELNPDSPAGLYSHGAALLDLKPDDVATLKQVKARWERYLAVAPQGPKAPAVQKALGQVQEAIAEGGSSKLAAKRAQTAKAHAAKVVASIPAGGPPPQAAPPQGGTPPALTQDMVDAVQNTERTPELEQGLAKLVEEGEEHLARGRFQEALDAYKRVVPFQPENGRAKAGMAWSLVGLNRQPMAERIWSVAVSADAASVDRLGDVLKSKGNAEGAKALWKKLAESSPAYASKVEPKLK